MLLKVKYFFLTLVVLIGFSSSTYAEGDTYCTGRVTGVTNLQNVNAGQISFNSHEGPGFEDNESVDLSVIGEAGGLAPASREYAACVDDATGTYDGDAYEYGLHGFSWNNNLGFISYACQDGKNRAGEGTGVNCGDVDYGVYIDSADDLFGHAYSSAFGWMQFRGQGETAAALPEGAVGPLEVNVGESTTTTVTVDGLSTEYRVDLLTNTPPGASQVKLLSDGIDLGTQWIDEGATADFGPITLTALESNYLEGPTMPHLLYYLMPPPIPEETPSTNLGVGETISIAFQGQSYDITLNWTANFVLKAASVTINGADPIMVVEGGLHDLGDATFIVENISVSIVAPLTGSITFKLQGSAPVDGGGGGEVFDYGVTMDANGYLHGYAWTEAGIWVDFQGARIYLPDLEIVDGGGTTWCEGKSYICLEVRPNPVTLEFDAGGAQEIRIADGTDGYYVHLFLMDETGDNPLVPPIPPVAVTNFFNSIQINWQDTVKINQTNGAVGDVSNILSTVGAFNSAIVKQPWANSQGAVTYKPLTFADFDAVAGELGHYIAKFPTSSYAPTDDGNLSWTTSTDPKYLVNNTEGRGEVEPNQLILKNVTYNALSSGDLQLPAGVVFPNGKVDLNLPFRPALEVGILYSGVLRDTLMAYRSVPENVAISMKSMGSLPAYAITAAKATFILAYSTEETQVEPNCEGANFDFHFLKSLIGADWTNANPSKKSMVGMFTSLNNVLKDIPVLATLPPVAGEDPAAALPCNYAKAPTLYSKIQYKTSATSPTVLYNHNGLPRISGSDVFNPQIVVHGNIVGQKLTGVAHGDQLQSSGSGIVSVVRDTINENVEKYIERADADSGSQCVITDLAADSYTEAGCSENYFEIGDEQVLYFRNADVVLDLDGGYGGQWVIIADGGDIFVHGDAYNADPDDQRLSLLAFHNEDFEHGNVYLGPCSDASKSVRNLQATIVADGGLMSYDGNKANIAADGRPAWASPAARVAALGCQLLLEGNIFAPGNTIGGADTDTVDAKLYILLGGGEVKTLPAGLQDRMKAQNDDLNYLRLFRLELEISPEGFPIDQRCGMGISPADVLAIIQAQLGEGPVVCGEPLPNGTQPCDPAAVGITFTSPNACDGINPFEPWIGGNSFSGDLVPPQNQEFLADRLDNVPESSGDGDFDPVYVFYVAPASDSFVFSKAAGF